MLAGELRIHGISRRRLRLMRGYIGGIGGLDPTPGKSQVVICILRNTGTEPPREAIGPLGSNCFSREVRTALC